MSCLDTELEDLRHKLSGSPRHGPGQSLGMLVVDFQRRFVESSDPLMAAALAQRARILAAARSRRIPVFLVRLVFEDVSDIVPSLAARFDLRQFLRGSASAEISPSVGPEPGDIVLGKKHASAFFATPLIAEVRRLGIDTLLVAGCATSGCVRATIVDGAAHGLRMELVEECVYDQRRLSGLVALLDIQDRYGDVIRAEEALEQIASAECRSSSRSR